MLFRFKSDSFFIKFVPNILLLTTPYGLCRLSTAFYRVLSFASYISNRVLDIIDNIRGVAFLSISLFKCYLFLWNTSFKSTINVFYLSNFEYSFTFLVTLTASSNSTKICHSEENQSRKVEICYDCSLWPIGQYTKIPVWWGVSSRRGRSRNTSLFSFSLISQNISVVSKMQV